MNSRIRWLLVLLALADCDCFGACVRLRENDLEARLVDDARDRRLDEFDLLSAALISGGVRGEAELDDYRRRLADRWDTLFEGQGSPTERSAVTLFEVLHDRLLTGKYHIEYTPPGRALNEGHYNCVSATILYYWLCAEHGLRPTVIATPEHVFVELPGDPPRLVETTCPDWFDRSDQERRLASQQHSDGISRRSITFIDLLGKVFYNRALAKLAENEFAEAARLLKVSLALDPLDESAKENLLATFNNWSLAEVEAGRFENALGLLETGRAVDPDYAPYQVNDLHLHRAWVLELCRRKRYAEALRRLEAGHRRRGDVDLFDRGRHAVYQQWVEWLLSEEREDEARSVLHAARARLAGDQRWTAYEAAALRPERSADLTARGS